jgi:multidrug efflux pump subunit AcrA (membrane-fusion protein)
LVIGCGALAVLLAVLCLRPANKEDYSAQAYTVKRSDLVISVSEGGTVAAANSQEIKCAVAGQTQVISVVPDGYVITDDDVKTGKVLLELDSSKLREQAIQQSIAVQDAAALYSQAKEQLEIQKNQNESDVSAAELQVEVARLYLEKYLGTELTEPVLAGKVDFRDLVAGRLNPKVAADFLRNLNLGGAASQTWEKLQSDIDLAGAQFANQKTIYEWSRKLGPKLPADEPLIADADKMLAEGLGRKWPDETVTGAGYIPRTDVEKDALLLKTAKSAMDQARLSLDIFIRYDFVTQMRTSLSAYTEATRQLERARAKARSALAMAEVNLKTREESLKIQQDHLDGVNKQVAACTIHATKPGMVVYPARDEQDNIAEGAVVRERQVILTIPDLVAMEVAVHVREASVDKVKPGQRAEILVDAFPDITLWGQVTKVARMPERPGDMSPPGNVYSTNVAIKDAPPGLKPGMSSQVEIMVDTVRDVLVVPRQAVSTYNGRSLCYVLNGDTPTPTLVETGQFNDEFIQMTKGLAEGEKVLLRQPSIPDAVLTRLAPKQEPAEPMEEATPPAQAAKESETVYDPAPDHGRAR